MPLKVRRDRLRAFLPGRRWGRSALVLTLLVAPMGIAWTASAQTPPAAAPRDETPAQALFREGREAMERNDLELACRKFDESHRLEGAVGPLLNLANCEEKRGRIAAALAAYRGALAILRPDQVDQRKLAEERSTDLAARVPTLTLRRGSAAPPETTATLDGAPVLLSDRPLAVDPGPHVIEVRAPGRRTETRRLDVVLRDRIELNLEPGAGAATTMEPGAPPPASGPSQSGGDPLFVGGLVAGGVGLAGLAVFAITGVVALDASSTLDEVCGPDHRCPAEEDDGRDAADTGESMLVPNAIGLGVGIVGLVLGVTLLALSGGERETAAVEVGPRGAALRF